MTVYLIAEVIIFALAYPFCIYKPNRAKNIAYVTLVFLYLWILSTLRYDVGNDYFSYINIFYESKKLSWADCFTNKRECGYMLLNKVISLVSGDYKVMHSVMAFLCIAPTGYVIAKYSKNIWLSCHLYLCLSFYYSSMNFIRQTLAATIIFLGYKWLKDRKPIQFIIVVLIAATFHSSALIMIPIYLVIAYIKPTSKVTLTYFVLVMLLYIFSNNILEIIVKFIPKYASYMDTKYIQVGLSHTYLVIPVLYLLLILFAYYEGGYNKERYQDVLTNTALISFGIWFFITKHFILERFSIYVEVFLLLCIPDVLECLKHHFIKDENSKSGKIKYSILMMLVIGASLWYNVYGMVKGFHGVFPYKSFLD